MTAQEIIAYVQAERENAGITLKELAEQSGYSYEAMRLWAIGSAKPRLASVVDVAEAMGLEIVIRRKDDEKWVECRERQPEPVVWRIQGQRRDGLKINGYAIYYADGRWYSLNGKLIWKVDRWLDTGKPGRNPTKVWRREE